MTARDEVVALLQAVLPDDINVMPYARSIDSITASTVMVAIDEITPGPVPQAAWEMTFALYCLTPMTTAGPADDELDALVLDVLFAMESSAIPNTVRWTKATRATWEEQYPAYRVDITVLANKE